MVRNALIQSDDLCHLLLTDLLPNYSLALLNPPYSTDLFLARKSRVVCAWSVRVLLLVRVRMYTQILALNSSVNSNGNRIPGIAVDSEGDCHKTVGIEGRRHDSLRYPLTHL